MIASSAPTEKLSLKGTFLVRQISIAAESSLILLARLICGQFAFDFGEARF